jgi:hypothetical protein
MKRAFALLCLIELSRAASAAATEPVERLTVVLMDDARMEQVRYLKLLLDGANIALAPSDSCLRRAATVEEVETCSRSPSDSMAPREPVLILNDAGSADRDRPGLARLVCVGAGARASHRGRQSITLWPRAHGLHSATPYIEDNRRLRDCLAAAQSETAP